MALIIVERDLSEVLRLANKRYLGVLRHHLFTIELKRPRLLLSHNEQYFPGAPVNAQKLELVIQVRNSKLARRLQMISIIGISVS